EEAGLPAAGSAEVLAAAIRKERPVVRAALLNALDYWGFALASNEAPGLLWLRIAPTYVVWAVVTNRMPDFMGVWEAADLADDDPLRKQARRGLGDGQTPIPKSTVEQIAGNSPSPAISVILAAKLHTRGERAQSLAVLRQGRDRHPTDVVLLIV